jgi:enoyl-CoA hydratase/carnithine racemase
VTALIDIELRSRAAVITLKRDEKLNALSSELERQLSEALRDERVRGSACVIVAGGKRAFSAGADVNELRDLDPASILAYYRATGGVYEEVASLPQPTIAAIAGHCLGGGLELALACDFRVADASASFGFPEVGIGIVPSSGGMHRLARLLGTSRAKELVLLRERFGPEEARQMGLVTETVHQGAAVPRALEMAEKLTALPRLAVALAKQTIDAMPESSREAGLALERFAYGLLAQTEDAKEAAEAFAERREPRFKGR